jgi:hypothetical protein
MCTFVDRQHRKRQIRGDIPTVVGVERTGVITSLCFVVIVIVLDEIGRIIGQRIDNTACKCIFTACMRNPLK